MGRWSQYDEDEHRLPEGMTRIGYDADDQTYTFRDNTDGSIWESAPGNQYSRLTRVFGPARQPEDLDDEPQFAPPPYTPNEPEVSWRTEMMPLLSWFMIIALFLLGVFYYLNRAAAGDKTVPVVHCSSHTVPYTLKLGDTCWALAENRGISLDALMKENKGINCDKLAVGDIMCLPTA